MLPRQVTEITNWNKIHVSIKITKTNTEIKIDYLNKLITVLKNIKNI